MIDKLSPASARHSTLAYATFMLAASPSIAEVSSPVLATNAEAATAKITVQALRGNTSILDGEQSPT